MSRTACLLAILALSATGGSAWSQESGLEELAGKFGIDLEEWANESLPGAYGRVGGAFNKVGEAATAVAAAAQLYASYTALDERVDVDLSAANTPRVPSSCAGSEECGACYERAQGRLNHDRVTLERLRVVGRQTKAMKDDALALGQSVASFPGMGFGWYRARKDILTGWQSFVGQYEAKYEELMANLRMVLDEIGACEAEYFDQPDWFDRYGFIYHQFMAERYHPETVLE